VVFVSKLNVDNMDRIASKTYLSVNEKMVLLGMVKYPDLNDRQIAEKIGLKLSTFTAIKNRLKKNGYFRSVRYPLMQNLGSEILFVLFSQLNLAGKDEHAIETVGSFIKGWNDVFYCVTESEHIIALGYSKNYTGFRRKADEMVQLFSFEGLIDQTSKPEWVLFPLGLSIILNNFNYTRIIEDHFGVEYRPKNSGDQYDQLESILETTGIPETLPTFTSTEMKVLYGLIKYPDMPDNKIATEVGTTRQAVARIKKKLTKKGIIRSIKVPNLKKLGFEIIAFTHLVFNPKTSFLDRATTLAEVVEMGPIPVIFHITKDDETTFITAHRNYEEFNSIRAAVYNTYKKKDYLKEEPTVMLLSNADLDMIKGFDFGDMVKNALEN